MNQLGMNDALALAEQLAKRTMDQLQRIAILSPYEMASVQSTYQMAMAFGFTSKEATSFTKSILNVAAGVGASGERLDRMSYNLAQIRMQGKVTAMDIRQLAMAGFDLTSVLRYVGKQMGINIQTHQDFNKALATGKVTWQDFSKYFEKYADENFGGAAERMSRTLTGLQSSFHDVFGILLPKVFGKPAERITQWLGEFLDKIMTLSESGALEKLGDQIDGFLQTLEGFKNISMDWLDNLLGINPGQEYINSAETPEDARTARKEIELEPPKPKNKIDIAKIISGMGWTWRRHQGFDARPEFADVDGLGHVHVTACGEGFFRIAFQGVGGNGNDRHIG